MAQGFMGQRKATFKGSQTQLYTAIESIFNSHWPAGPTNFSWANDCLPVDIQWGATNEKVKVFGNIPDSQISVKLESFNEYFIAVVYQLLRISDPWPITGKPAHPQNTTLTLRVRGGGEILQIDPTALTDGGKGQNLTGCFTGTEFASGETINSRIRIPLTEYHLTCDRITDAQLCAMMKIPWKCREGTVNCDTNELFLGEGEGTLLFDTWTLDQTWVPDIVNPRRWQVSCVLKCRQVPQMTGPYPDNCSADCTGTPGCYPIGWNHDFKRTINSAELGWQFIMMNVAKNWTDAAAKTPHGDCPSPFVPRYPYMFFANLFCTGAAPACLDIIEPGSGCTNECPDPSRAACTGEEMGDIHGGSEEGYEALEDAIAQIAYDARHANGRRVMRENEAERQGTIEKWADGQETTDYWKSRIADDTQLAAEKLREFKERMEKQQ